MKSLFFRILLIILSVFFRKKSHIPTKEVAKEGIKKVDTVVTGLILGGLIASIYGIKKIRDIHQNEGKEQTDTLTDHPKKVGERGLLKRLIFGNK